MKTAFALINSEVGMECSVLFDLSQMPEVMETYLVYGGYEIIVKVAAETVEDLKNVINYIRNLNKIKSIITLLCVQR
jgi:DNA-binding Lrp family transcriptional regulator